MAFALTVSAILVASAALQHWYGTAGVLAAAGLAGFVDAQSAAISVASALGPILVVHQMDVVFLVHLAFSVAAAATVFVVLFVAVAVVLDSDWGQG